MNVLVADDDPVSRRILQRALERSGHEVTAVADGREAAARLTSDGPRLALLDWMMPGLEGIAVCQAVRQRPGPYVYIILITARDRREDLIAALDAGVDDFLTKPIDLVELDARIRSGQRIVTLQEDLLRAHEALRQEATHDALTGLANRRAILARLVEERSRLARGGRPLALVLVDLDHFKRVNDTYGHRGGDLVLQAVAERFREVVRDCDCIGRYGGEELLLVLPGCDGIDARRLAERLRQHLATGPVLVGDRPVPITFSAGVVWTLEPARWNADDLIQAADAALYRAKTAGRNCIAVAQAGLSTGSQPAGEPRRSAIGRDRVTI